MKISEIIFYVVVIGVSLILLRYLWPFLLLLIGWVIYQNYKTKKEIQKQEETTFQNLQQQLFQEQVKRKEYEGEVIDAEFEEKK